MNHEGPDFYDDAVAFDTYTRHRQNPQSANDTLERPVIDQLLGEMRGQDVLDLGCGDAAIGRDLLAGGAASYLGIDGSQNMIAQAQKNLQGTRGRALRSDLQQWDFPVAQFSRVISRLVLHYLPTLEPLLRQVHRALRPDGLLVFSVEHPVITSHAHGADEHLRDSWLVDDYFATGPRVTEWLGARVIKHHRTVEDHFSALQACGFRIEQLRESRPERANFQDDETCQRRMRIPLFLFFAARKIGGTR